LADVGPLTSAALPRQDKEEASGAAMDEDDTRQGKACVIKTTTRQVRGRRWRGAPSIAAAPPRPRMAHTPRARILACTPSPSFLVSTLPAQTVYLPIPGLVDPSELRPGDLIGTNKDSYLILEKLPTEYDPRVKVRVG
jgi:ATP-dependent 26S proteasome regulatory subunit